MKRSHNSSFTLPDEDKRLEQELFGEIAPPAKRRKTSSNTKKNIKNNSNLSKSKNETSPCNISVWIDKEDLSHKINVSKRRELRNLRNSFSESKLNQKEFEKRTKSQYYKTHGKESWVIANENRSHKKSKQIHQISKPDVNVSNNDSSDEKAEIMNKTDDNNIDNTTSEYDSTINSFFSTSLRMSIMDKDLIDSNNIAFTDLGQLNGKSPHKSVITSLEFHPNGELLLMAGLDKSLQIYQITGKNNTLLKKIFFNDLPIRCAKFTPDGKEIIITGRRYYFYIFDLITFTVKRIDRIVGRDERSWELFYCSPNNIHLIFIGIRGQLVIVSRSTKKAVKTLHVSEQVSNIKFNFDGSLMYCLSTTGRVYIWDMLKFQCVDRVMCNGIVKATSMSVFPALNLIALGCNSGIMNLYRYDRGITNGVLTDTGVSKSNSNNSSSNNNNVNSEITMDANGEKCVLPLYSINNLVTTITDISFNHDGQLMVLFSKNKKRAIRLVNVQTNRVYANWPKDIKMGYIQKCTFSPHSGYMAIGNDSGYVRLIRLHFYGKL